MIAGVLQLPHLPISSLLPWPIIVVSLLLLHSGYLWGSCWPRVFYSRSQMVGSSQEGEIGEVGLMWPAAVSWRGRLDMPHWHWEQEGSEGHLGWQGASSRTFGVQEVECSCGWDWTEAAVASWVAAALHHAAMLSQVEQLGLPGAAMALCCDTGASCNPRYACQEAPESQDG